MTLVGYGEDLPSYVAATSPDDALTAVTAADAAETASRTLEAGLQRDRASTAAELDAAREKLDSSGVAMARGAIGHKGTTTYREAAQEVAELEVRLAALDDRLIPQAAAETAARTKALGGARRDLARARMQEAAVAELIPADRRVFALLNELEAALEASSAARQALRSMPGADEFFTRDSRQPLDMALLARGIRAGVYRLGQSHNVSSPGLGDPGPFHAITFGLTEVSEAQPRRQTAAAHTPRKRQAA